MSKNAFVQRRSAVLMSVAAMATTGLIATAGPAGAVITAGGTADAENRPEFHQDGNGVALVLCTDATNCEPADAADPLHGGYFAAEATAGPVSAIYGIETAAGEDEAGNPTAEAIVANVARFRAEGLQPGARYVVKDPWGSTAVFADGQGDLDTVLESGGEVGTVEAGHVTTFLRRLSAPAGFLGDLETAGPVTGSPTGFNALRVTGPGVNVTQRNFVVNGQMRADTPMTSFSTAALKMGSVRKSTPTTRVIPVDSFGTAAASLTATKSGANPGLFQVNATETRITVTYTPRANRNATAILSVDDLGDLAPARTIRLSGVGHDTLAPRVMKASPARGATGVRVGQNVTVRLSEAVRGMKGGFSLVDNNGRKVRSTVKQRGNTWVLNPRRALDRNSRYTVRLNGGQTAIRDLVGNAARDIQWRFRTR